MTTTTYPMSFDYGTPAEFYGDFAADFDTAAIDEDVLDAINAALPADVTLSGNGQIVYYVDYDGDPWQDVKDAYDALGGDAFNAIVERHEVFEVVQTLVNDNSLRGVRVDQFEVRTPTTGEVVGIFHVETSEYAQPYADALERAGWEWATHTPGPLVRRIKPTPES